ncbi:MAG TPA: hypothetical protein PK247_10870 [Candidatus Goldiibacteriota bacterium]|nr:hypothetical protein [Candidatus Goldiibacteriota bacterium]
MTITPTSTITPTYTITPVPVDECAVEITIFDSRGETVKNLPGVMTANPVHGFTLSSDPFKADGRAVLVAVSDDGSVIASWDGRADSGEVVPTGMYMIKVKSKDKNNNEFLVIKAFSVILDVAGKIESLQVNYAKNYIRVTGTTVNAEWIKVKIFNINAEIIQAYELDNLDFIWDLKTVSGSHAAAGIYIIYVEIKDVDTKRIIKKYEKFYIK